MHTYKAEGPVNYANYRFYYTEWAELARNESPAAAYAGGFLPSSACPRSVPPTFYMARSLRIDLDRWTMDKKRRYDHRRWQARGAERRAVSPQEFNASLRESAVPLALEWMGARFGMPYLEQERLERVLDYPLLTEILTWQEDQRLVAYSPVIRWPGGAHYWYVFYEPHTEAGPSPGHGYLADFLVWSREQGLAKAYLGTAYGRKSRYKSRGFSGVEFWNGTRWEDGKATLHGLQDAEAAKDLKTS